MFFRQSPTLMIAFYFLFRHHFAQSFLIIFWLTNLVLWTVIIFFWEGKQFEVFWNLKHALIFSASRGLFKTVPGFPATDKYLNVDLRRWASIHFGTVLRKTQAYLRSSQIFNAVLNFYWQVVHTIEQIQSHSKDTQFLITCQKVEL